MAVVICTEKVINPLLQFHYLILEGINFCLIVSNNWSYIFPIAYPKFEDVQLFLSQQRPEDIEQILLRPDDNGKIPLHIACAQADTIDPCIVEYILKQCPETVVMQNLFGLNALHVTLLHNARPNIDIVRLLCRSSQYACAMQRNKSGMLPIHVALSSPRRFPLELIQLLLQENGPQQLQEVDNYGYLPLHHAISNRHSTPEALELLLGVYPDAVMAQDIYGCVCPGAITTAL